MGWRLRYCKVAQAYKVARAYVATSWKTSEISDGFGISGGGDGYRPDTLGAGRRRITAITAS